jgi:hypothetical protein
MLMATMTAIIWKKPNRISPVSLVISKFFSFVLKLIGSVRPKSDQNSLSSIEATLNEKQKDRD